MKGGPRGGYARRPTQDHPAIVIPNLIYARITIAAHEAGITPETMVEEMLKEGLKRHGQAMDDDEFYAACRTAEAGMRPTPQRHEFNQGRGKRVTDPH